MNMHEYLRTRITHHLHDTPVGDKTESLDALQQSEWSETFEQLMRNRLLMGRFRYGSLYRVADRNYNRVGSSIARLEQYRQTGNLEHLVDVANLCLVEFVHSRHPHQHFAAADDGEHVLRTQETS